MAESDEELTPKEKEKLRKALEAEAIGKSLPKRSERVSGLEAIRKKIKKNGDSPDE